MLFRVSSVRNPSAPEQNGGLALKGQRELIGDVSLVPVHPRRHDVGHLGN